MNASDIIEKYIKFFEDKGHKRIPNYPLVPENDPTTLFTSSGMQPIISYLLGESHPEGRRLVDVQNCFRAQDIDEIGDSRHTTFFRMLGNWSLGDYFKKEQLPWFFEFLTKELGLDPHRFYITVFEGYKEVPKDEESFKIWQEILEKAEVSSDDRIFFRGVVDNWWSRSGVPENMPEGEPGGPDSEVYFDLEPEKGKVEDFEKDSQSGRLLEIGNSVFMEYLKTSTGFSNLPQQNVDFGGGLERLLAAVENKKDIFETSLFQGVIKSIEEETGKSYKEEPEAIRIIADHLRASVYIAHSGVIPSNKEQGYVLRRLIRRGLDNFYYLQGKNTDLILEKIVEEHGKTDPGLIEKYEKIKGVILEEEKGYKRTLDTAKRFIEKKYKSSDELKGVSEISAEDAFILYSTHGLSPSQIKSLGFSFDGQEFAEKMEEHQKLSRSSSTKKFAGGLADHSELTIKGHTATHLMHKALRDMFGESLHQSGSNITNERVRFDFNFDRPLTEEEIKSLEDTVNGKISENLPVYYEFMPLQKAKDIGAIGLFDDKYKGEVKVYLIGSKDPEEAYSKEFCGGPHVSFTSEVKSFKIIKQEAVSKGQRRLYAKVG